VAALTVLLLGTCYFHAVFKGGWLDAVYFVVATVTTTGYGDVTPDRSHPIDIIAAMLLMLAGTIITGLFIAFGASLLTRVHWVRMQGLRPVHRRGHIVVCGAGSIAARSSTCSLLSVSTWSSSRSLLIRPSSKRRASSASTC
jgi:hypothetical protein